MRTMRELEREMYEDEKDRSSRARAAELVRAVAALEDQIRGGAVVTLQTSSEHERIRMSIDDEEFEGETLVEALTGIPESPP